MKRKLLSAVLAFAMVLALCPAVVAHGPAVPGLPCTMDSDVDTVAVVDTNGNLWVYNFKFVTDNRQVDYYGAGEPEIFDTNVASVSVCDTHIAYVKTDGSLWVYGSHWLAAGNGESIGGMTKPYRVMDNVIAVSVSNYATAAIRADNSLWLWGALPGLNPFGYAWNGTQTPFKVADDVVAVSLVSDTNVYPDLDCSYGMFLKKDGTLWGWGSDASHILSQKFPGIGSTDQPLKLMSNVASFAAGDRQCAAVTTSGDLYVWGYNDFGSLGFPWNPDTVKGEHQCTPKKVMSGVEKAAISTGRGFSVYALKKDGSLWGAGNSQSGQLGEAYMSETYVSRYVKVMDGVTDMTGVEMGVYVTKADGSLYAAGSNLYKTAYGHLAVSAPLVKYITTPTLTTFPCKVADPKRTTIGTVEEPAGNPFTDIAYGSYCYDAVLWALEKGVTTGTSATTFSPSSICTRGQVATFLWRANGCPEPKTTVNPFTDVKSTDYFYKAVLWALENGITTGTSETTFSPNKDCSEHQIITFLWRALGEPHADISVLSASDQKDYFATARVWAYDKGLVSSVNSIDYKLYDCTRANVATYLYKTFG